jgi:hypothetical protein
MFKISLSTKDLLVPQIAKSPIDWPTMFVKNITATDVPSSKIADVKLHVKTL